MKHLFHLLILIFLFSCSSKKKIGDKQKSESHMFTGDDIVWTSYQKSQCYDSLIQNAKPQKRPSTKYSIAVDSVTYGNKAENIGKTIKVDVNPESDLIPLNDYVAVKLFRAEFVRYNVVEERIAYDLFEKKNNCWTLVTNFSYSTYIGDWFSSGTKGNNNYIKVKWEVNNI